MALSATANAELKVATVDVQKLFADYYKTHEAQAEVDKAAQTVQETNNTRAETIKKMEADFNDMVKRLQDPMLNEKDKKELEQEVIALEQERRGFVERQLKSLQEQMKVRSAKIMGEITKITEGIATKGNYDLVLDKSAQALRSNQVFVYTKPGMDITPTVMKELNKDAPEGFDPSKKKAPAVPAAPAAPAN